MKTFVGILLNLSGLEKVVLAFLVIMIIVGLFFIFRDVAIEFIKLYKSYNDKK